MVWRKTTRIYLFSVLRKNDSMKLFIKKSLLFIGAFLLLLAIFLAAWFSIYSIPAPNISNSYSFNEKMLFLNEHYPEKPVDILAIGSSMSLNNLHTNSILEEWDTDSFLNSGSWGLNIEENFQLLKVLQKRYTPKKLIISSIYWDFMSSAKSFDYPLLEHYLSSNSYFTPYYYSKNFSLKYLVQEAKNSKKLRSFQDDYDYLGYDNHGGINFTSKSFQINDQRWDGDVPFTELAPKQYQYLDSISNFCKKNKIDLYFIQSPFREGYYSQMNKKEKELLNSHIQKVEKILSKNNNHYVNTNVTIWPDNLFVDYCHFNNEGAKLYTEYFFTQIKDNQ